MSATKIIYPELSYQIVGLAFKVYNEQGFGFSEKLYQKLFEENLKLDRLSYKREVYLNKTYNNKVVIKYFLDFVVEEKIVVELKVRPQLGYVHIKQVMDYLKIGNYELAILIYFSKDGVKYRRILNASLKD